MSTRHDRGVLGEDLACSFLKKKGYRVLERNYRITGGEIDIVAQVKDELVFVEVKLRSSIQYGYPEEGVSFVKQKRLARAIRSYLKMRDNDTLFRFDIIAVAITSSGPDIEHLENIEMPVI